MVTVGAEADDSELIGVEVFDSIRRYQRPRHFVGSPSGPYFDTGAVPSGMFMLDTLGLTADFTQEDLKQAYKRKAMEHHPDRGGSERKFEQVTTAYTELRKLIA